jgi:glycosyltransferase involved in cell wall biosynthesis
LFKKGKWFYAEYNIRLFFYLLFNKADAVCAIDLDTILACFYLTKWKKIKRVYDAHELFTELKEVVSRPSVYKIWKRIEEKTLPHFPYGYTVSHSIAEEFRRRYGVNYETIRNVPVLRKETPIKKNEEKFLLYQGAINEARAFEWLIPAMKGINAKLIIIGDGNFMHHLKKLIQENNVEDKVVLKGMIPPDEIWHWTENACIGISLAENTGLNQYYALPNKFFDYVQAGLPQLTMNYPEYRKLNNQYEVAVLTDDLSTAGIAKSINNLLQNDVLLQNLRHNCLKARKEWCWQIEEQKLLAFYQSIFNS